MIIKLVGTLDNLTTLSKCSTTGFAVEVKGLGLPEQYVNYSNKISFL